MNDNNDNASMPVDVDLSTKKTDFVGGDDRTKGKGTDKPKSRMQPVIYWIISILTFGLLHRFYPRKKGRKGTWFVTVLMLTLFSSSLITERFFKTEFNQIAREKLQIEVDVIPEVLPFEDGKNAVEEVTAEFERTVQIKDDEIKNLKLKFKNSLESTSKEFSKLQEEIALKDAQIEKQKQEISDLEARLNTAITERSAAKWSEVSVEAAKATQPPVESAQVSAKTKGASDQTLEFKFSVKSLSQASKEVGCETKYSVERSLDEFDKEYVGNHVKWTGTVVEVNKDYVEIKAGDHAKAKVFFQSEGAGYYMVKGEEITMRGRVASKASCDVPFVVMEGIQK